MRCNKTKGYNNQQLQVKMTKKIKFTKMHGAGNDYIYVDTTRYPIADPEKKQANGASSIQELGVTDLY